MQFRRQVPEPVQLNLTPLIDVVFLLLIFFMVTTRLTEQQLSLRLPTAETAVEIRDAVSQTQTVNLYEDGRILLGDQQQDGLTQLETALQPLLENARQPTLIIRAEGATPHQQVVAVLDMARRLGFEQVRIATRPIN